MPFHPKKILATTDFSACSTEAIDAAGDLAKTYGAELTVVHVIAASTYVDFGTGSVGQAIAALDYVTAVRAVVQQRWQQDEARLRARGVVATFATREGSPALEIASLTKDGGFDVVVVGTHGRTGLKHVLLGSVAAEVVRQCQAPVLTVRPSPSSAGSAKPTPER